MKIQVQFNCPVGVIVDTETGEVDAVHVWDEHIETETPTGASRDEYLQPGHPDYELALTKTTDEYRKMLADSPNLASAVGVSLFEPMPLEHPEVVKAIAIAQGDAEWPAWDFGC